MDLRVPPLHRVHGSRTYANDGEGLEGSWHVQVLKHIEQTGLAPEAQRTDGPPWTHAALGPALDNGTRCPGCLTSTASTQLPGLGQLSLVAFQNLTLHVRSQPQIGHSFQNSVHEQLIQHTYDVPPGLLLALTELGRTVPQPLLSPPVEHAAVMRGSKSKAGSMWLPDYARVQKSSTWTLTAGEPWGM